MPDKPNYVTPNTKISEQEMRAAAEELRSMCSIKDADQVPPDKYDSPHTSAQEYGWASKPLGGQSGMFTYSRNFCELTKYADAYYRMSATTPFSAPKAGGTSK